MLLPIGPGQPRIFPVTGLERIENGNSRFLADGKPSRSMETTRPWSTVLSGKLDDGKLMPVTPEGITGGLVSPDSGYMLANNGPVVAVFPIGGGPPTLFQASIRLIPVQWSEDELGLYGYRPGQVPTNVFQINLVTGQQTVVQELHPEQRWTGFDRSCSRKP